MSDGVIISVWVPLPIKEYIEGLATERDVSVGSIIKEAAFDKLGIKFVKSSYELPKKE